MKEYLLELKVKNNYLSVMMKKMGISNQAGLARHCGVTPTEAGYIMNMKQTPYNTLGELRPYVDKVLDGLGCGIEEIYPPEQIHRALEKNIYRAEVEAEELRVMLESEVSISGVIEYSDQVSALNDAISGLPPRLATILKLRRFDEKTLAEVGEIFGVSSVRIRQMEERALAILKNPKKETNKRMLNSRCGI